MLAPVVALGLSTPNLKATHSVPYSSITALGTIGLLIKELIAVA